MKAKEVMKLLNICRTTLYNYTRDNVIKSTKLDNGYYDYDEQSVLKFIKKDNRINVIYARVSTYKQKNDLINQINKLETFCLDNDIIIDSIFSEISSGLDLDRIELNNLLDQVFNHKIKNIYISNKDRLTRLSFKTLETLLKKFNTNIIVINDHHNQTNDNEIFEELISLMHIFSTTMYSNRRKNKINIYKQDIENFISDDINDK
jgi:predicted site-specific integrase-resolvase